MSKLHAMKRDWEGVVADRGVALTKIKDRLKHLESVPRDVVIEFYDAILAFGKAGGHVELLDGLIEDLSRSPLVRESPEPGEFRL